MLRARYHNEGHVELLWSGYIIDKEDINASHESRVLAARRQDSRNSSTEG